MNSSWQNKTQVQTWKDRSPAQGNPHLDSFTTVFFKWSILFTLIILSNVKLLISDSVVKINDTTIALIKESGEISI